MAKIDPSLYWSPIGGIAQLVTTSYFVNGCASTAQLLATSSNAPRPISRHGGRSKHLMGSIVSEFHLRKKVLLLLYAQKLRANGPHGNPVPPALSRRSAQLWLAASKLRYVVTNRNTNLNWAHIPLGHTNVSMVVTLYPCHSILLGGC